MANYKSYYEVQPGQTNAYIYYPQNAPTDYTRIPQMPYYSQQISHPQTQHQQIIYHSQPQQIPNQGIAPLKLNRIENEWQIVQINKRPRSPDLTDTQKQSKYWLDDTPTTRNRFRSLKKEPKPPPMFVEEVKNMEPLITLLDNTTKKKYVLKTLHNEQVKIQPEEAFTLG
ncbi:hypothetical protein FQA39_LY12125 [Lamprigera yunnana]|nr:hypothetical protein FQA39_LY12125 [Lamprigera yunnana]